MLEPQPRRIEFRSGLADPRVRGRIARERSAQADAQFGDAIVDHAQPTLRLQRVVLRGVEPHRRREFAVDEFALPT